MIALKKALPLIGVIMIAAAAGPKPLSLPRINPPTIMPAEDALTEGDTMWMKLGFMEIDPTGNVKFWGYLQGPISRATPAVFFTRDGKWMAAVYDRSPDLAQTGFWYVGRDPSGYLAVLDGEIEGAFGELILARSADGIRWRPVGVMKKKSFTQLFMQLEVFDGGRWEIVLSAAEDTSDDDRVFASVDSGRSWGPSSRPIASTLLDKFAYPYFAAPLFSFRGNRAFPRLRVEGEIRNPKAATEN